MLIKGRSYLLNKLTVCNCMDKNYLALTSSGTTAEDVEDLENVVPNPQLPADKEEISTAVTVN